jgi:hypothetical protein
MLLILPVFLWLTIAVTLYTGLWFAFMRRLGTIGTSLFNLGLAAVMSPGLWAAGHGAIPFPGGLLFLLGSPSEGFGASATLNFAMWMLTFTIFSVHSRYLKNS